jgi:hypothetical protein
MSSTLHIHTHQRLILMSSSRPIPDDTARLVASGRVDPYSYKPFDEEVAKTAPVPAPSAAHDSDSGAHLGTSHEQCDEGSKTVRMARSSLSVSAGSYEQANSLHETCVADLVSTLTCTHAGVSCDAFQALAAAATRCPCFFRSEIAFRVISVQTSLHPPLLAGHVTSLTHDSRLGCDSAAPSSRRTQRPFMPPRGSQSSQSSLVSGNPSLCHDASDY